MNGTASPHLSAAFRRATASPFPEGTRGWLLAVLLAAAATGASAFRIVLAPGFELYLAPIFYLFAYRIGGLRIALPVAILTMLPSWFWWGHIFSIALAAGHVIFIDRVRTSIRSLALATLAYSLTFGAVGGYLFLHYHYGASGTIVVLSAIRKLLNDVTMAALVDLGFSIFRVNLRTGTIARRPHIKLTIVTLSSVTLMVTTSTALLFVSNARQFVPHFNLLRNEMSLEAELHLRRNIDVGKPATGLQRLVGHEGETLTVAVATRSDALRSLAIRQRLGCTRIEDGSPVSGPNDRNTFAYWMTACVLAKAQIDGREYWYLYSTRPFAEEAYRHVLVELIGPGFLLAFAVLLELFLTQAMNRSLVAWRGVIDAFGNPDIPLPKGFLFSEFERPIEAIVAANNSFAALVAERAALAKATMELKREMDLSLATDIRFDEEGGTLSFTEISVDRPTELRVIPVHSNDRMVFASQRNCEEAFAEFRIDEESSTDWYLLVGRDLVAPGCWRSGWMVRLRQSKLVQDRMLHQARLVDLGGMASAISHELKQPLSTICLSAENGRILIDQAAPDSIDAAKSKFDRIIEQVFRARDIIVRISRYARIEDDDPEPVDLGQVVNNAFTFMRPLLVQENVSARIDLPVTREPLKLLVSRIGLEQLFVNAIQNSVDAIVSRRVLDDSDFQGAIDVIVSAGDTGVEIRIIDNGTGLMLDHGTAFDAFITTKAADHGTGLGLYISRQIVTEIGGNIAIRSRELPQRGAEISIALPAFVIADKRGRGRMIA